jgi:hypothetical protein
MSDSAEMDVCSPPAKKMLTSKARTSLMFNEPPEIPSSSFYGKVLEDVAFVINKSISPVQQKPAKTSKINNKLVRNKPRQSMSTRRIPGTINNGIHIRRMKKIPRRVQTREEILKSIDLTKFTKLQIVDTALQACTPKSNAAENDKKIWAKQLNRLREMWNNTKNPSAVIKPITLNTTISTDESISSPAPGLENVNPSMENEVDEQVPEKTRKFFKTGSTLNKNRFNLINNIFAHIDHGKVHINPPKKKKRKLYKSMFEEEGDDEASMVDPNEIGDILKTLDTSIVTPEQSPTSQLRNLTIELSLGSPIICKLFELD